MATAFLLWPAAPSSSADGSRISDQEPDPGPDPTPQPIAKPKARKAGGKQPAPKRPPQRGLGVAQLERLRLQERWSKITDQQFHPSPPQLPPYAPPTSNYGGVSQLWNDLPPGSPGYCYIQRYRTLNPVFHPSITGRSVVHDQYEMDRIRFFGSGPQAASPPPVLEPPSNQKPQCLSSHCELCTRNQFSGEDQGFNGAAKVVLQEKEPDTSTREIEYYEFLLPRGGGVSHGDSEFAHRTAEDGSSSSPDFIDLSLKLSF